MGIRATGRSTAAHAAAALLLAGAALLTAESLQAQACIGMPIRAGQIGVAGHAGFTGDATRLGGEFAANMNGPLSLGFGYARTGAEGAIGDRDTFSGRAALQMLLLEPMTCPVVGVRHTRYTATGTGGGDFRIVEIPVGVGIGASLPLQPGLGATIYGIPQLVFQRTTHTLAGADVRDDSTEFEGEVGLRVWSGRLFGGGSVLLSSARGADPVLGVMAGFAF